MRNVGPIEGTGKIIAFSLEEDQGLIKPNKLNGDRKWIRFNVQTLMRSRFLFPDVRAYENRRVSYKAYSAVGERSDHFAFSLTPLWDEGERVEGVGHIKFFDAQKCFGYIETDASPNGEDIRFDIRTLFASGFHLEDPNEYKGKVVRFEAFRDSNEDLVAAKIVPIDIGGKFIEEE